MAINSLIFYYMTFPTQKEHKGRYIAHDQYIPYNASFGCINKNSMVSCETVGFGVPQLINLGVLSIFIVNNE